MKGVLRLMWALPALLGLAVVPVQAGEKTGFVNAVFKDKASATLKDACASTHCHGATGNQLHLTCGDTDEQKRWNYFAASQYIGATSESSELLRRPLDPSQGGAERDRLFCDQGRHAVVAGRDSGGARQRRSGGFGQAADG